MRKIRVMIVEDSRVAREMLESLIADDPRLEVAVAVPNAEEALRLLPTISPDVISLDIRLPGMNGLEATQRIMAEWPTPIVVVSACIEADHLKTSVNALRAGALAVIEKPAGAHHVDYETMCERLCTRLAVMSQVKVVRQRISRGLEFGAAAEKRAACPAIDVPSAPPGPFQMLGIAASTGGPGALDKLLRRLTPPFPVPVMLVQHMSSGYIDGFISWLSGVCPLPITAARDGVVPRAGTVYVATANRHLCLARGYLRSIPGEPVSGQCPSGNVLFRSLAQSLGPAAVAVLLTGMGDDGAAGLKEIHDAGGYTIAEDKSTAVVYGMPGAAVRIGAAREVLPLDAIGPRLRELIG